MTHRFAGFYIAICSLLWLLPSVAWGQTASSSDSVHWSRTPVVKPHPGETSARSWLLGGFHRSQSGWYLEMPAGIGDLISSNFVDGYSLGPHATVGKVRSDRSRWEVEETVRYALSRKLWLAKGALRWYSPVEQGVMVELRGGRHTEDIDREPYLPTQHAAMAAALFGYDHAKLLERTEVGARVAMPIGSALDLQANVSWEQRAEMQNHLSHSLFGAHPHANIPQVREPHSAYAMQDYEGGIDGRMALIGLRLSYQAHRTYYVYDDMTCQSLSAYPLITLTADAGMGRWHYASVGLEVSQQLALPLSADRFSYLLGGGAIFRHGELGLTDWHHFDANCFWWQAQSKLSHFALLHNYELSTDRTWLEGHLEWASRRMLLTRLFRGDPMMREYLQYHVLSVPDRPVYAEVQHGLTLAGALHLGYVFSMDGIRIRDFGIRLTIDLEAARALNSKH